MASRVGLIGFVVVAAAAMLQCSAATNYTVGDNTGWTIPSSPQFYTNWASGKTFAVGDVLSFSFNANAHDVAKVSKTGFDSCTSTGTVHRTSPTSITLDSAGNHYFICTFSGHCAAGQKLSITVGSTPSTGSGPSSSPPTSPSPTPPPTAGSTSPSSPSSASSLATGFGGLVAVLTAFFL